MSSTSVMETARPPLPTTHRNPLLQRTMTSSNGPVVKYQILNCQGTDILVGRLKIETNHTNGHAFILRRFDTEAISLTTMYRAAFPTASDQVESKEVQWVKDNYNIAGNNGSKHDASIPRLAGTWISPPDALELGHVYGLGSLIDLIVNAKPDPDAPYRRSNKQTPTKVGPQVPTTLPPVASNGITAPTPAKRRKEASPAPPPYSEASSTPRRSTRAKSRSPTPQRAQSLMSVVSSVKPQARGPRTRVKRESSLATPGGSDETAVEGEDEEEGIRDVAAGEELHKQDVREQKEMIENLKQQMATGTFPVTEKRAREDDELKLNIKDHDGSENPERAIATNSRVRGFNLETRQKSFAWGVGLFAVGLGAVAFMPNLV